MDRTKRHKQQPDLRVESERVAGCKHCERLTDFTLPEALVQATADDKLAIFAGAGVSTEGRGVFKTTLYEEIAAELGIVPKKSIPFPVVMSRYCSQPDGRRRLILEIRKRFAYLKAFPEVRRQATRFHTELATIPFIMNIFTTNWDDLFEQETGATPIVTAQDFVFWDLPIRKVYKLHGSVSNYGSLVLTQKDYQRSYRQLTEGVSGANLKLALATKTLLFAGYSLNDSDFKRLYRLVAREMGELGRASYIVTLDGSKKEEYRKLGLIPILADAAHFLSALKSVLVARRLMLPDGIRPLIYRTLEAVLEIHHGFVERFDPRRHPLAVLTTAYQDGLIHGLEHLLHMYDTGESTDPHHQRHIVATYQQLRRDELRDGDYFDVAYIDGYIAGMTYPLAAWLEAKIKPPVYYIYGEGAIWTLREYQRILRSAESRHPRAYAAARRIVDRHLPPNGPLTLHHIPFL